MNTLDQLTRDQRATIYDWLVDFPTKEVVQKVALPAPEGFGIKTHPTTLRRFKDRYWAELSVDREESAKRFASSTTNAPENGDKLAIMDGGIQVAIRHHMFERVSTPDCTDAQLAMVSRWSHRQEKLKLEIQRVHIARERCAQNQLRIQLLSRSKKIFLGGTPHFSQENVSHGGQIRGGVGNATSPSSASTSRDAINESTAAGADQNAAKKTQHSELRTQNLGSAAPSASASFEDFVPLQKGEYVNEQGRVCDHLGPIARNWDEVAERARIAFGLTHEEAARRAELRRKYFEEHPIGDDYNDEPSEDTKPWNAIDLLKEVTAELEQQSGGTSSESFILSSRDAINEITAAPAEQIGPEKTQVSALITHDASLITSAIETPSARSASSAVNSSPVELAATVDRYTVARMREHIAYQRNNESWPHRHSPPKYVTEFRHCPCGHQCPCPVHESEKFGPFPERFWKISPTNLDYAAILRDRDLPFRFPSEYIA